jgi:drug/metabolite transporter (DMT)-like permease
MNPDLRYALIVTLYVTLGVSGELLLSRAMRRMPDGKRPLQVLRYVVTTPLALIGTALLTLNFGMLLALLSKLDVSLIVPSHAASYLLVALTARWLLHERVPPRRWVGVALITLGVSLVLSSRNGESSSHSREPAGGSGVHASNPR